MLEFYKLVRVNSFKVLFKIVFLFVVSDHAYFFLPKYKCFFVGRLFAILLFHIITIEESINVVCFVSIWAETLCLLITSSFLTVIAWIVPCVYVSFHHFTNMLAHRWR